MTPTTSHICPNCGTENSGFSMFCAECGADLSQPSAPDPGATRPFEPATSSPPPDTTQSTDAYRPIWDRTWSGANTPTPEQPLPLPAEPETHNLRGFFLGSLAVVIIIALVVILIWASMR